MTARGSVFCSTVAGVATLTLNRPEKLNALRSETIRELRDHLTQLRRHEDLSCVVLAGAGRSFCAGLDLDSIEPGADVQKTATEFASFDFLESFPLPTIAKVRGHCLAGGLELALACDILICGEDARFGDAHARWGMVPTWGLTVRLPERIGRSRAKLMSFSARTIDGAQAALWGLADACVADDDLDAAVGRVTSDITGTSRGSNRIYKSLYSPDSDQRARDLRFESSLPFGLPDDMHARLDQRNRR